MPSQQNQMPFNINFALAFITIWHWICFVNKFIERLFEDLIKAVLHRKREQYIQKTITQFHMDDPLLPLGNLEEKLNIEADRVYAIVDRSILRERIQRSKYVFLGTIIFSTIIVGALGGFTSGSALPFIAPLCMAFVNYVLSMATVGIGYNQRVKGGMDTVVIVHKKSIQENLAVSLSRIHSVLGVTQFQAAIMPAATEARAIQLMEEGRPNLSPPLSNSCPSLMSYVLHSEPAQPALRH